MQDGQCSGIPEENARQGVVTIGRFASGVPRYRCCITVLQAARKQDSYLTSSRAVRPLETRAARRGIVVVQMRGVEEQAGGISKSSPVAEPHRAHDSTMTACLKRSRQLWLTSTHFLIAVSGWKNRPHASYPEIWMYLLIGQA